VQRKVAKQWPSRAVGRASAGRLNRAPSARKFADLAFGDRLDVLARTSPQSDGRPQRQSDLRDEGIHASDKRVAMLVRRWTWSNGSSLQQRPAFLFVAIVLDVFRRRVVGRKMENHLRPSWSSMHPAWHSIVDGRATFFDPVIHHARGHDQNGTYDLAIWIEAPSAQNGPATARSSSSCTERTEVRRCDPSANDFASIRHRSDVKRALPHR